MYRNSVEEQAVKQISPVLLLDMQYLLSLSNPTLAHSQNSFISLSDPTIHGLWLPSVPLQVSNALSLQKGIALYNNPERDLSHSKTSAMGTCYSRIGLVGNPSDGYFGNTISITVENFSTTVSLIKSTHLQILPHPMYF